MNIYGMEILTDANLTHSFQHRHPRSKGKRIVDKWRKNKLNWKTVPSKEVMYFRQANTIVCHPSFLHVLEGVVKANTDVNRVVSKGIGDFTFTQKTDDSDTRFDFGFRMINPHINNHVFKTCTA